MGNAEIPENLSVYSRRYLRVLRRDCILSILTKEGEMKCRYLRALTRGFYKNPNLFDQDLRRLEQAELISRKNRRVAPNYIGFVAERLKRMAPFYRDRNYGLTHMKVLLSLYYTGKLSVREICEYLKISRQKIQDTLRTLREGLYVLRREDKEMEDMRKRFYLLSDKGIDVSQILQNHALAMKLVSRISHIPSRNYFLSDTKLRGLGLEARHYVEQSQPMMRNFLKESAEEVPECDLRLGRLDWYPMSSLSDHFAETCNLLSPGMTIESKTRHGTSELVTMLLNEEIDVGVIAIEVLDDPQIARALLKKTFLMFTYGMGNQNWWNQFIYVKPGAIKKVGGYTKGSFYEEKTIRSFTGRTKDKVVEANDVNELLKDISEGDVNACFGSKEPLGALCEIIWGERARVNAVPSATLCFAINSDFAKENAKTVRLLYDAKGLSLRSLKEGPNLLSNYTLREVKNNSWLSESFKLFT